MWKKGWDMSKLKAEIKKIEAKVEKLKAEIERLSNLYTARRDKECDKKFEKFIKRLSQEDRKEIEGMLKNIAEGRGVAVDSRLKERYFKLRRKKSIGSWFISRRVSKLRNNLNVLEYKYGLVTTEKRALEGENKLDRLQALHDLQLEISYGDAKRPVDKKSYKKALEKEIEDNSTEEERKKRKILKNKIFGAKLCIPAAIAAFVASMGGSVAFAASYLSSTNAEGLGALAAAFAPMVASVIIPGVIASIGVSKESDAEKDIDRHDDMIMASTIGTERETQRQSKQSSGVSK